MADKLEVVRTKTYPTTIEGIAKFYDEWAATYDQDLVHEGYINGLEKNVEAFEKVLPDKNAEIVDMPCGTGMSGEALKKAGYKVIDGVDISKESLKVSEGKGIYRRLINGCIAPNKLCIEDDTYDGLLLSGGLALGHLNQDCFPELIRIVKPGGAIVMSVGGITKETFGRFKDGKLDADIHELVQKGLWEIVFQENVELITNDIGNLYTFKVL